MQLSHLLLDRPNLGHDGVILDGLSLRRGNLTSLTLSVMDAEIVSVLVAARRTRWAGTSAPSPPSSGWSRAKQSTAVYTPG